MEHFKIDYEGVGFRPSEILALLKFHDIPVELEGDVPADTSPQEAFPEWKRVMSLDSTFVLFDVVCAIIGIDPYDSQFFPDDAQADFRRYEDLLHKAIARGELAATEVTTKRNDKTWQMDASALLAWCEAKGIVYPLPLPASLPMPVLPKPSALVAGRWPWGEHTTKALALLADAARQWWSTYDPAEPQTAPTNNEVVEHLVAKGASTKLAESIASILRADDLPTGRRKSSAD
ncbi:hypothetical protein AB7849_05030 [Rhodanobacter sp. 115]|uniref:hypothetical protein n=1 Tax=Rhodanobacter sp. FW021-MT20 TaxID=1162282 RepID=UPI000260CE84|nr:hypothetical protein [Rhodanobacter sp. 115]EIL88673.1 hypothetical protein UU5_16919 [Rhodanobacter sp. 115]